LPAFMPAGSSGGTCSTLARLQMNTTRSPAAARLCAKWKRMDVLPLRTGPRLSGRWSSVQARRIEKDAPAKLAPHVLLDAGWRSQPGSQHALLGSIPHVRFNINPHLRTGPVTRQCSKCDGKAGRFRRSACKRTSCPADKKSLRCRTMPHPLLGPLGCEPQQCC